jgi:predicted TIM-barrel fold metal-dependent hydrolase
VSTTEITGVDAHAHVLSTDAELVADRHSQPSRNAPVADYLALLDANGLSHGILTAPSFYGTDNTVLLDAIAAAPHRLHATANVSPDSDLAGLRSLGVVGIRLNWSKRRRFPDPNSAAYQRLFAAARDSDMHVEVLVEDEHVPAISAAVLRTGAELVLDHFGLTSGTGSAGLVATLRALDRGATWVKLSAPYRLPAASRAETGEITAKLLAAAPDRLLWGSDWPWVQHEHDVEDYAACLRVLTDLVPDPVMRKAVLVDNPTRAFRLKN